MTARTGTNACAICSGAMALISTTDRTSPSCALRCSPNSLHIQALLMTIETLEARAAAAAIDAGNKRDRTVDCCHGSHPPAHNDNDRIARKNRTRKPHGEPRPCPGCPEHAPDRAVRTGRPARRSGIGIAMANGVDCEMDNGAESAPAGDRADGIRPQAASQATHPSRFCAPLKHASILDEEAIRILTTPRPGLAWVNASGMVEIQPGGNG